MAVILKPEKDLASERAKAGPHPGAGANGANIQAPGVCEFRVWAPTPRSITLRLNGRDLAMRREGDEFTLETAARAGDQYSLLPDGSGPVPDPVSRSLPQGVHGPTEIVDPAAFQWHDQAWKGIAFADAIFYELHVGTFTEAGDFDGVIGKLDYLKRLGVTAIELMPVAAFPHDAAGGRNWGYDGVSLYAVESSYGGPAGLKRLVDAAHAKGLAVVLDVVYNHLGNEGNYLRRFAPYFTARHKTPWGEAIDYSLDAVRQYFIENALNWLREYHMDGLRLDAVQTIFDERLGERSPHILAEMAARVGAFGRQAGREVWVIAETDANDANMVKQLERGGNGMSAFWSDDFHHAVHALLTGEREGYYQDFGSLDRLARALRDGYVFQGERSAFWDAPRGTSASGVPLPANVICIQNHDQVGNRARGERLTALVPSSAARCAAAALLLLAPHTPLVFMGQEFDEAAPFQFFTSYGDAALAEAVRHGRREEFKDFDFSSVPDPQDPATLERSRLDWRQAGPDNAMLDWYRQLIALRKDFVTGAERTCNVSAQGNHVLLLEVPAQAPRLRVEVRFGPGQMPEKDAKGWERRLYAEDEAAAVTVSVKR